MTQNSCPFCDLSGEQDRVVLENEHVIAMPTYGQIAPMGGYVVLVPKAHVACIGAITDSTVRRELTRATWELREKISRKFSCTTLLFEHGIVGQSVKHAHLHIMPAPVTKEETLFDRVRSKFPDAEVEFTSGFDELCWQYGRNPRPYLLVPPLVCWDPQNVPMRCLRTEVAHLWDRPELEDWKAVRNDPIRCAQDDRLIAETVKALR